MKKKRNIIKINLAGCKNFDEASKIINMIANGKIKLTVEKL